jgi:hypothetical protein
MFQVFQRARFCACSGWGNAGSADSDAVGETIETRNTVSPRPSRDSVASTDPAKDEAMTREEALALYRPIRASMRRILSAAFRVCNQPDVMRAAKQLGLWADGNIVLPEDDEAAEMLADVALFEPNQRRRGRFVEGLSQRR